MRSNHTVLPSSESRDLLIRLTIVGILMILLGLCTPAHGQAGAPPVLPSSYPPRESPTLFNDYAGGSNLVYTCYASPSQPTYTWTYAGSTITSIVDSGTTSTITFPSAHGLLPGNMITISGATDTNLNGSFIIQTTASTTTATITTASVADATYTTGLVITTSAPLLINPIWSIRYIQYSSSLAISVQWAQPGGSGNYTHICANRAVSTGTTKIEYR